MKKLISKLKEVPDLESKHPWLSAPQNFSLSINNNENTNSINNLNSQHNHLSSFIGKKFQIGRFLVVVDEIIAEGGFGLVFKVRSQTDQIFALKRLCVNNRIDLKVCKREITIMSSLTHKNILSLIDSQINEQQNGIFEVLMLLAYCPKNVAQLMKSKQKMNQHLSENVITKILCDIIEAVARLHYCQTPVIHRDLKVENILIDERNNYVLCDFGSATARQIIPTEYGIGKTEEEILKYTTLAYRSPEMVQLGSDVINCKSDIWALGCLLYYLCYFTLPFADRVLAIQSGKFTIPKTDVVYSDKILKLIPDFIKLHGFYFSHIDFEFNIYYFNNLLMFEYMLTVDPADRPSIYQVSVLAFSIANGKNPIQNLDKEKVPQWDELPLPNNNQTPKKTVSENKGDQSATDSSETPKASVLNNTNKVKPVSNQNKSISTSINPRIRPRANKPPLEKSDSTDNEKSSEKPTPHISQSNSFNISLSSMKSNLPKLTSSKLHCAPPIPQDSHNQSNSEDSTGVVEEPNTLHQSPLKVELTVERNDSLRTRIGHRRMVSESSSKPVVEENMKPGKSLLELTRKYSNDQNHSLTDDDQIEKSNFQSVSIKISDDEVDYDAMFGEEFDKIRHQSETSGGVGGE